MSAENSSSIAARGHELWSLREDVSLEGDPFRDPVRLHGRWGDITIPRSSQLVRETLYRMGLGPISLENATSAAAMPARGTYRDPAEVRAQVTELHSVLERLQPLIVRSLAQKSGQPLLSVVPLTMRSRFHPVPLAAGAPFRLSVYACLRADGHEYSIESPLSLHRVVLHRTAAMRLIAPLASPITPAAFTAALSLAEPTAARVLEYLAAAGMVVGAQGAGNTSVFAEDLDTAVVGWSPVEMMFHIRSTLGRHDHNFGVTYPAGTTRPVEPVVKPQANRYIPLHTPRWDDLRRTDPPVVVAMELRRSARRYAGSPITAAQLGDLLYRTARVRSLITAPGGQQTMLQLAYFDRSHRPVTMDVGPVLALEDLAGSKVCALASRVEPRDYIDTAAAMRRYPVDQLIGFAKRLDAGLEDRDFADAGRQRRHLGEHRGCVGPQSRHRHGCRA